MATDSEKKIAKEVIKYQVNNSISDITDSVACNALFGPSGFFGFVEWFAKFLFISLSDDLLHTLPMEMFNFNFEVCSHLTKIFNYGSGKYSGIDAVIYNFNRAFH